jgi:tetratricopeptide (TPR) repeat protein
MLRALLLVLALQAGSVPLAEMLERARQNLESSDRAAARRELTAALKLYPTSPAVYNFLGVLEAGEGNYGEAERRFREAVLRAPDYTDAWLNLGRLCQENGATDPKAATKALAAYQAILRYEPSHAAARFQSAALLQAMGEFGRSLEELGRLAPADQDRPAALAVRLADHAGKGERAEADAAAGKLLAQGGYALANFPENSAAGISGAFGKLGDLLVQFHHVTGKLFIDPRHTRVQGGKALGVAALRVAKNEVADLLDLAIGRWRSAAG